ncbi:MAG: serine/threonine protein kinase [Planctomycetes bacterium]|nr:serine/threonine protein kinase [Planctomycetota bacterium]
MSSGSGLHPPTTKDQGPAPAEEPPPVFWHFRIEGELGRGRHSIVYKALNRKNEAIALKILLPGDENASMEVRAAEAKREAECLKRLNHPNIVGVLEHGAAQGKAYIAFPFVKGSSLDDALREGQFPREKAATFMAQAARAVHCAHEQGLIHRDLKPGNIILGIDGQPHVLDFGLSWRMGDRSPEGVQSLIGTPAYMSPEQARGNEEYLTPASDVYGLGAVLYEILTGRPPFAAETVWKTIELVKNSAPKAPREIDSKIDANLERIVLWSMEKEPNRRYRSADALAEDLELVAAGKPPRGPGKTLFGRLFGG